MRKKKISQLLIAKGYYMHELEVRSRNGMKRINPKPNKQRNKRKEINDVKPEAKQNQGNKQSTDEEEQRKRGRKVKKPKEARGAVMAVLGHPPVPRQSAPACLVAFARSS